MSEPFRRTFTATPEHIDEMGHVNNAVWVQWVQDMATAHWQAVADPDHARDYVWLVIRHEIDYRGNIEEGESVTGETWIPGEAKGAKSTRRVDFRDEAGKVIVSANTSWAMLHRQTRRLARVRPEIIAPFMVELRDSGQEDAT